MEFELGDIYPAHAKTCCDMGFDFPVSSEEQPDFVAFYDKEHTCISNELNSIYSFKTSYPSFVANPDK